MKTDLRTKAGRRAEVIAWVREHRSLSAFWITEHHLRAIVVTEMIRSGELITRNRRFPFMSARLK